MSDMISLEQAKALILENMPILPHEEVPLLEVVGRVSATDLMSDIDIAPFDHSAMDGFVLYAADIAQASEEVPSILEVVGELAAGDVFEGSINHGQCVRIMTGAPIPEGVDAVVKYEIVDVVSGDGKVGSLVAFKRPTSAKSNIREAGEEALAGQRVVEAGEVIGTAGVGFLASCGVLSVPTYRRPRIAIIAIGSELVEPNEVPSPGKIRNSNSYALAACAQKAGALVTILPIVEDTMDALIKQVRDATQEYDCVITSGGASNGDYDFIKPVVEQLGKLFITTVNIRPGKAQTFGLVGTTPVFGLPGNPAAAYVGFEMLVRPALRKMQGYTHFDRPIIKAHLSQDMKKNDARRIFLRSTLSKNDKGEYVVVPAKNQSSGLFGVIQRSNCMAVMPEGLDSRTKGSLIDCILLDVDEEINL